MKRMHPTMILFLAAGLMAFAGTTIEKPMETPGFGAFRGPLGSWEAGRS
ncbi:MAG: hypothetical protein K9M45_06340 [Kiritimatiellales bacterium]|nr:hypothetical protein [Kiritimatiellales bacterium]